MNTVTKEIMQDVKKTNRWAFTVGVLTGMLLTLVTIAAAIAVGSFIYV